LSLFLSARSPVFMAVLHLMDIKSSRYLKNDCPNQLLSHILFLDKTRWTTIVIYITSVVWTFL